MTTYWRDLPIASKLAMLTSLLVLVVVVALTSLIVQRERASFHQELESQANLLLNTLPLTLRDQLYLLELDELLDVANIVGSNEDVTLFVIYNPRGAELVDASKPDPVFAQSPDPLGAQLIALDPEQRYWDWQEEQLVAGRSIVLGNQTIGAVALGLSTEPLTRKIAVLTQQSLILVLGTLALGSLLSFLLARQITNPLRELSEVAARMAGGDLSQRPGALHSKDEVGRLGAAFNQMADAIQKRDTELRDLAAGLERTVAARTAELREQNTALREANEALTIARQEAEAANRAKSAVLSMVSHEMRTPMTSILGFARLVANRLRRVVAPQATESGQRMQKTVTQIRENMDIIVSEGERLLNLTNNLLDLAKIEAGKFEWNMQPVSIKAIIQQAAAATAALFEDKPLELLVDIESNLPKVIGDHDRLIQVMVNLISNAVKFTETGMVTCCAHHEGASEGPGHIIVSVQDTGVGIASEDYEKVFEQFVQVGERVKNSAKGTGLGLPICKQIVEYHQGTIWVESVLGEGSTFSFTIPVPPVTN